MTEALTTMPAGAPEPPISEEEAASIMAKLKINADPQALILHQKLGTYLIQHDVGACHLARNFDSEAQVNFAIEVSRELAQSPDPDIRARGVNALLLSLKTRLAISEQSIKLAAASRGKNRAANRPPIFHGVAVNGPVTLVTSAPSPAISV